MNALLATLSRTPFLIILMGVIAGIIIGYRDISYIIPITIILFSWSGWWTIARYSNTPQRSLKLRHGHWIWAFTLFTGIGMLSATLSYPKEIDNDTLTATKYASASVKSKETSANGDRLIVEITGFIDHKGSYNQTSPFDVLISTSATDLTVGDKISFPLDLKIIENNGNYQGFDYASYMINRGIRYRQYCHPSELHRYDHQSNWRTLSITIRDRLIEIVEKSHLQKNTQEFVITMLLGDKSYMPDETRQIFSNAGIAHILALSGLHVGIIIVLISSILFPLGFFIPRKIIYLITIVFLWIFSFITGMSASVVRASIMATFYLSAKILERQNDSINALLGAITLILIVNPSALYDVGLQLSALTVTSIILFSEKLNFIDRYKHPRLYHIFSTFVISLIAVGGSWIVVAYYFHIFPLMFIPANAIVVPLLPFYISITIIHLILSSLGLNFDFLILIIDTLYTWLISLSEFLAFDGAIIENIWVSPITIILYFISITFFTIWLSNRNRYNLINLSSIICLTILSALIMPTDKPRDGFIVQDRWDSNLIRIYENGCDSLINIPHDTTIVYKIYDKQIVCIDENSISKSERKRDRQKAKNETDTSINYRYNCDYVVLCKGYRGSITHLLRHYDAKLIVLMPEIFNSKEQSLVLEAQRLNVPIHSIDNNGALKYLVE